VRAGHATCVITIIPGLDWQRYCTVVTHEVGHSVLGGHWFARVNPSNPSNPAHSPSPRSVMYPTATTPQACTHRPPTT